MFAKKIFKPFLFVLYFILLIPELLKQGRPREPLSADQLEEDERKRQPKTKPTKPTVK